MEGSKSWRQTLIMLLEDRPSILFVGVYDTERFELVSESGSDDNAPEDGGRIVVTPSQARAIYSHIKYGKSLMVRIDIADLDFMCLRNGVNSLAGMSNFNIEEREVKEADRMLFSLTHEHYTRQHSVESVHALHIAATLHEDHVIIGIAKAGDHSMAGSLKDFIMIKDGKLLLDKENQIKAQQEGLEQHAKSIADAKTDQEEEETVSQEFVFEDIDSDYSDDEVATRSRNKPLKKIARVEMRASTKSEVEKKQDKLKRETSFCEDWRTATIRSIEALQMMSQPTDNDIKPLLDDVGICIDDGRRLEETEQEVTSRSPETRRQSRITTV